MPVLVVVMAFFAIWIISWLPIGLLSAIAINWRPNQPLKAEQKLPLLISLYLLAPFIVWLISSFTNRSFSDYGWLNKFSTLIYLGLGFILGVVGILIMFACQLSWCWCTLNYSKIRQAKVQQLPITMLSILLVALFIGGVEELVFRGFLLTELQIDYRPWVAVTVSSLIFALLHLVWERKETLPQLPGLWIMGIILVLARFVDGGNLGLAWGLHSGWVWMIATIDTLGLIDYTGNVSEYVTGRHNKPLAGATGIACLLLSGGILCFFN
ncbi:CPBP family intramembrane glutamic endopeptidase [Mastigocoleus sp. MO_188.B34]|uniref:CPBP family intramembrane glutamic endopeptidase n=1 Tax=Mastigocoleus sp. MO_188.B34 TaxID=3036635 RepID=UPI0034525775